jgi:hypothetical protein
VTMHVYPAPYITIYFFPHLFLLSVIDVISTIYFQYSYKDTFFTLLVTWFLLILLYSACLHLYIIQFYFITILMKDCIILTWCANFTTSFSCPDGIFGGKIFERRFITNLDITGSICEKCMHFRSSRARIKRAAIPLNIVGVRGGGGL